jgi:DEAD/DEAH box helicase
MSPSFDPLATSELITSSYRRYLRSLLPVREPRIAAALDAEISHSDLLTKGPLLEATPPYKPGATLDDLVRDRVLSHALRVLDGTHLPFSRPLYLHQEQAIRKIADGRNVIVASGTGSGKTESFVVPILDSLDNRTRWRGIGTRGARSPALSDECAGQRPDQAAPAGTGGRAAHYFRALRR